MEPEITICQGVARNVEWVRKSQARGLESLTFRIEQLDDEGNVTGYMCRFRISGTEEE